MNYDPDCRLCNAAVPDELGWLYAAELTGPELARLCRDHSDAIERRYPR